MTRSTTATLVATLTATGEQKRGCSSAQLAFEWSSSDPSLISVAAGASGTATISALAPTTTPVRIRVGAANRLAEANISVLAGPAASLVITPANPTIVSDATRQFSVEFRDAGGFATTGTTEDIVWRVPASSPDDVSPTGLVTARGTPGSRTVTATYTAVTPNLVTSTGYTVVPSSAAVASITVSPALKSLVIGGTVALVAVVKDASGNVLTGRTVTWQSLSPAIATVSGTGVVTGVSIGGPAFIHARAEENPAIVDDAEIRVETCTNAQVLTDSFSSDPGAAWTTTVTTSNPGGSNHTHTATYVSSGGGPGAIPSGYRRMAHHMNGIGTLTVFHRREIEYDPSVAGNAIANISYSEDQIMYDTPSTVGWGFFLEQNNTRYTKSIGTAVFSNSGWLTSSMQNLTSADFPGVKFGPDGGPIKFGYYRANTSTSGIYTVTHGIDNWRVAICRP